MKRIAALVSVLALCTVSQAGVSYYSSHATTGAAPAECTEASTLIKPLIAQYHGPSDWKWIIACDETAWNRVEAHTGMASDSTGKILGLTDLENHVTYIRGFAVLHPFNESVEAQPDHTIAHELGHILANTRNEDKAERKGQQLIHDAAAVLVAVR